MANKQPATYDREQAGKIFDLLKIVEPEEKRRFLNHAYLGNQQYSQKTIKALRDNIIEFGAENTLLNLSRIK